MLSQTVDYALRAAVYLASQRPSPRTTEQIAQVTYVPKAYLSKVMQSLSRAGLVRSQRGVHGGFTLAEDPADLTILQVVEAVDPIQRISECPLGLKGHQGLLCPLHQRLDDAMGTVEAAFRDTTLAEILAERTSSVPLCEAAPDEKLTKLT